MAPVRKFLSIFLVSIFSLILGWFSIENYSKPKLSAPIKFGLIGPPYSMDPMEFNSFVHLVTARPVLATLVSQYKSGTIVGQIAESWSNSDDLRTWTFYIRPDLTFSNGDKITADAVRLAFTRIAFLQFKSHSASGLTEHLKEVSSLTSASQPFPGIEATDNQLILRFVRPQPKLLEAISFGLYAVAHSSDFNPVTGAWDDHKAAVASGPFQITHWDDRVLTVEQRKNVPAFFGRKDSPKSVDFVWHSDDVKTSDITMGSSLDGNQHENEDYFGTGALTTSISYIRLLSWNDSQSPLKQKKARVFLRNSFYKKLESFGVRSHGFFLPTSISPSTDHPETLDNLDSKNGFDVTSLILAKPAQNSAFAHKLYDALSESLKGQGIEIQPISRPPTQKLKALLDPTPTKQHRGLDIIAVQTNLLVEDPIHDVKFMINSKEGIRLPDPTGRLKLEAAKERPDFAKINEILWDDAIIWPVTHFSSGLWAKKGLFDFSQINLGLPPTDISWIGINK